MRALPSMLHCGGGSFKSQMKKADASGARYAVIVGDDEAGAGVREREAAARGRAAGPCDAIVRKRIVILIKASLSARHDLGN